MVLIPAKNKIKVAFYKEDVRLKGHMAGSLNTHRLNTLPPSPKWEMFVFQARLFYISMCNSPSVTTIANDFFFPLSLLGELSSLPAKNGQNIAIGFQSLANI